MRHVFPTKQNLHTLAQENFLHEFPCVLVRYSATLLKNTQTSASKTLKLYILSRLAIPHHLFEPLCMLVIRL